MTHNHSLFKSLCTRRWTRACSLSPEAPSFWLAFQARPALCMHVFVKVQCSTLGSTLEDKCFSFFSTDWRWQWWRTSNSAVTAFIAKRLRVAYSCSYVLLVSCIRWCQRTNFTAPGCTWLYKQKDEWGRERRNEPKWEVKLLAFTTGSEDSCSSLCSLAAC